MKNGWRSEEQDNNAMCESFQTEAMHLQMCCLCFELTQFYQEVWWSRG